MREPAPRPHAASPGVEHIVTSHSGYRAITLYAHADANALAVLCRPIKQIFECERANVIYWKRCRKPSVCGQHVANALRRPT